MSTTLIRNASIDDVKQSLSYFLRQSIQNADVRQLAIQITENKDDAVRAVYDWVKQNVKYVPDPINAELFISPIKQAEKHQQGLPLGGDCDDHALFIAALLGSIGYQTRILLVDSDGDQELDHALSEVQTNIGWISADTTSQNPLGWVKNFGQTVIIE